MNNDLEVYLRKTNGIRVEAEELIKLLNESAALGHSSSSRDFGSISIAKVRFQPTPQLKEPSVESATVLRILALFRLLGRNENYGWSLPKPSSSPSEWSDHRVFSVAASEPLVAFGDEIGFDPTSFAAQVTAV